MDDESEGDDWSDGSVEGLSSTLDYRRLCKILDPLEATTLSRNSRLSWHKIIDRKASTISFCQIEHPSTNPSISRCVCLRTKKLSAFREVLQATVFLNDTEHLTFVRSILGKCYVESVEELTKLLRTVETAGTPSSNTDLSRRAVEKVGARLDEGSAAQRLNAILDKAKYPSSTPSATNHSTDTEKTEQPLPHRRSSRRARELNCAQQVDGPDAPATAATPAQLDVGIAEAAATADMDPDESEVITMDDTDDDEEWLPPRKKVRGSQHMDTELPVQSSSVLPPNSNSQFDNFDGLGAPEQPSLRVSVPPVIPNGSARPQAANTVPKLAPKPNTCVTARISSGTKKSGTALKKHRPYGGQPSWSNVSDRVDSSRTKLPSSTTRNVVKSNAPVPLTIPVTDIVVEMPVMLSSTSEKALVPSISDSGIVDLMEKFYWNTPGEGQVALVPGSHIHVKVKALEDLKSQYGPPKEKKWMKYAKRLILHLVGGWTNVLKYKKKYGSVLYILGGNFINTLTTHLEDVFKTTVTRGKLLMLLNKHMVNLDRKLLAEGKKRKSGTEGDVGLSEDVVLSREDPDVARRKRFLEGCYWTTPGEVKVQLCAGYDVYVYKQTLADFTDLYGPTKVRRNNYGLMWSKYAECLFVHLSGGWDNVLKDQRPAIGSLSILGPDVFRAVAGHIKELFGNESDMDHLVKKVCRSWSISVTQARQHRTVRGSIKRTCPDPAIEAKEKFAEYLDTCYWKTPGEDKTPLHPGFEIYVYPAILEDLRRQYGPGTPHVGIDAWGRYAINLYVHLICGWDKLMKYRTPRASVGRMMDDNFLYAMLGHMRELFKTTMTKRDMVTKLDGAFQVYRSHRYKPPPQELLLSDQPDMDECYQPDHLAEGSMPSKSNQLSARPKEGWENYYWSSPGDRREQLHPGYGIYVDQRVLEEIAKNFGPKRYGADQWSRYALRLLGHLVGGWENYLKDRMTGAISMGQVLGDDFGQALAEHVQDVFQVTLDKAQFIAKLNGRLYQFRLQARKKLRGQKSTGAHDNDPEDEEEEEEEDA